MAMVVACEDGSRSTPCSGRSLPSARATTIHPDSLWRRKPALPSRKPRMLRGAS